MYNRSLSALSSIPLRRDNTGVIYVGLSKMKTLVSAFFTRISSNQHYTYLASTNKGIHKMLSTIASKQEKDKLSVMLNNKYSIERNTSKSKDLIRDKVLEGKPCDEYSKAIQDLNMLQSNTKSVALAKYKIPKEILPLFAKQLNLAGIDVRDLDRLNIIHVSGTKGKGSTCAFVESILRAAGHKTGFYNSPHLVKVTERIKINGQLIDDVKFSGYFRQVFNRLLSETEKANITMPSYFSFLTILAFHIFLEEKVDCAIVEVGIGGEYDPTNIVRRPIACGISTLDYDHTNILGNTMESIAWSKAGIAKKNVPLFVIEREQDSALKVIKSRVDEKGCPLYICKPLKILPDMVPLGIRGSVQYANASLACQLAKYYLETIRRQEFGPPIDMPQGESIETNLPELPTFFQEGLTKCSWPGRCQVVKYPRITFFLDGAHTKKSMENCLDWFLTASKEDDIDASKLLLVNIIGDRNRREILRPLSRYNHFEVAIFSTNRINSAGDTPKSETFVNIQGPNSDKSVENVQSNANTWACLVKEHRGDISNSLIMPNTSDSIRYINRMSKLNPGKKYHVLATGSLHFVGAILETLPSIDELLN